MHKTPTRPFKHHSKRDSVEFLRKKKQRKVCLCIRHLFRNKWGSWRSEEGAEWGRVMPVFVQVKCGGRWGVLCVRNCGATTESACAVRGWVLHRLNRLGATAAFLQEWGSAFWANSGMSLRAEEWVRGPVSARLCAAFVESSRTRWREGWFYSGFFGTCTQTSSPDTFLRGSHAFWCNCTPRTSEHRLIPFTIYECVFVFVRQWEWAVLFLHTVGGSSHCWLAVDISGGLLLSSKPQTPWLYLKARSAGISFTADTQSEQNV